MDAHHEVGQLIRVGVVICALAIVCGPWYTEPGYDWVRHSISELAGQDTANAWVMRIGLAALGLAAATAFVVHRSRFNIFFFLFGISILLTAVFPHRPFVLDRAYSETLDRLHSLFATLGGFAAVLAFAFEAGRPGPVVKRLVAGLLAALYTGLSAAMFQWPDFQGALQRVIFGTFIIWMLYFGGSRQERDA